MKIGRTKTVSYVYSPHHMKSLEKYLEKMALKGWLLKNIWGYMLTFTKIQPTTIKYSVDTLDKITILDNDDSDQLLDYIDLCKASGWDYLCRYRKILVFYSYGTNPYPIHTDEKEKYDVIKSASKKYYILYALAFLAILAILIYPSFSTQYGYYILCNNFVLVSLLVFLYPFIEIGLFIKWIKESERKLLLNDVPSYEIKSNKLISKLLPSYMLPRASGFLVQIIIIISSLITFFNFTDIFRSTSFSAMLIPLIFFEFTIYAETISPVYNIVYIIKEKLKSKKTISAFASILLALFITVSVAFVYLRFVGPFISDLVIKSKENIYKPLSIEDFSDRDIGYDKVEDWRNPIINNYSKSIIAEYYSIEQIGAKVDFSYNLFKTKISGLTSYFGNKLVSNDPIAVPTLGNGDTYVVPIIYYEKINTKLPTDITVYKRTGENFTDYVLNNESILFDITFYKTPYTEEENLDIIYNVIFKE